MSLAKKFSLKAFGSAMSGVCKTVSSNSSSDTGWGAKKFCLFKKGKGVPCSDGPCCSTADNSDVSDAGSEFAEDPGSSSQFPRKIFATDENLNDKLVGVVVTIFEGSSYDEMFREIKPTTVPGERLSTYAIQCRDVKTLYDYLAAVVPVPADESTWNLLIDDVQHVPADSVVFNWECCSGCGDHSFPCCAGEPRFGDVRRRSREDGPRGAASATMQFMALAVRRGHTVMCSDFSLKSLIYEWSEVHLGPNPFVKVGECTDQFQLEFVPSELQNEDVPQQLQVVGELCKDQGKAVVSALGGTILYTVNPKRLDTDLYNLKILTVATDYCGESMAMEEEMKCSLGEGENLRKGLAGHVTLTYASGGQLVTSMGHWIELTRINTSLESVLRVAAQEFGEAEVLDMQREYASKRTDAERFECVQKRASTMVQKSVPSRMKGRTKFSA